MREGEPGKLCTGDQDVPVHSTADSSVVPSSLSSPHAKIQARFPDVAATAAYPTSRLIWWRRPGGVEIVCHFLPFQWAVNRHMSQEEVNESWPTAQAFAALDADTDEIQFDCG